MERRFLSFEAESAERFRLAPGLIHYHFKNKQEILVSLIATMAAAANARYAAVLGEIFPDRPIEAALIWTDGPKLMPIPEKLIGQSLAALHGAG